MPKELESWGVDRLQPMTNPEDARTAAVPMLAAGAGAVIVVLKGQPIGLEAVSKRGRIFQAGDNFIGYNEETITVDEFAKCNKGNGAAGDSRRGSADTATVFKQGTFNPGDLVDAGAAIPAGRKQVDDRGYVRII